MSAQHEEIFRALGVLRINVRAGVSITANSKPFFNAGDRKMEALWVAALNELETIEAVEPLRFSGHHDGQLYRVTHAGYTLLEALTDEAKARFNDQDEILVNVEITVKNTPEEQRSDYVVRASKSTVENAGIEWDIDYVLQNEQFRLLTSIAAADDINAEDFGMVSISYESDVSLFLADPKSLPKNPKQMHNNCWVWKL